MFNKTLAVVKISIRSLASKLVLFTLIIFPIFLLVGYDRLRDNTALKFLEEIINYLISLIFYCGCIFTLNHFKQLINLGCKRKNFFFGIFLTYFIFAVYISFLIFIIINENINSVNSVQESLRYYFLLIQKNEPLISFFTLLILHLFLAAILHTITLFGSLFGLYGWIGAIVFFFLFTFLLQSPNISEPDMQAPELIIIFLIALIFYALSIPILKRKI